MEETRVRDLNEQVAREAANLRSLLEPDIPAGLEDMLSKCRPFTGATLALLQQTKNEWLHRLPPAEMENHYFATLAWLFIQSADEKLVRKVVWSLPEFRAAVFDWSDHQTEPGAARVSAEQLAAADAIIQHTLGLVDAATFSVQSRPDAQKTEDPPPNS